MSLPTPTCRVCLRNLDAEGFYHSECLVSLFGMPALPKLAYNHSQLMRQATEMMGKMSISGIQEKVSLKLSQDKAQLELATTGGQFILKPEPTRFASLPQNEHLTMRLAMLVGIEVPSLGLLELQDGTFAYLIKRFDRLEDGTKLAVEDFCQLSEAPLQDKYQGSVEQIVRLLRKFATEPEVEISKLFKISLFSWWVSNGDQHLKNFSMYTEPNHRRLTPAYDLICTRLPIPSDTNLALTMGGKRSNITSKTWTEFGVYCQLPSAMVRNILDEQIAALQSSVQLIQASYLPRDLQEAYEQIVQENTRILQASSIGP